MVATSLIIPAAVEPDKYLQESLFFLTEALTVLQWGRASDRLGRRPILLAGMIGLFMAMVTFGFSKYFWIIVLSRCAQGVFNGNIGVSKSVMGEITDETNAAEAFSFIPLMWLTGITIGHVLLELLTIPIA